MSLIELLFLFQITAIPTPLMGKMGCWLMPTLQVRESREMPILMMMNTGPLALDQVRVILDLYFNTPHFHCMYLIYKYFKHHVASYTVTAAWDAQYNNSSLYSFECIATVGVCQTDNILIWGNI